MVYTYLQTPFRSRELYAIQFSFFRVKSGPGASDPKRFFGRGQERSQTASSANSKCSVGMGVSLRVINVVCDFFAKVASSSSRNLLNARIQSELSVREVSECVRAGRVQKHAKALSKASRHVFHYHPHRMSERLAGEFVTPFLAIMR